MDNSDTITYPGEFSREYATIRKSQWTALHKMVDESYLRSTGLSHGDPPEVWRFAISRAEHLDHNAFYRESLPHSFRTRHGFCTIPHTFFCPSLPSDAGSSLHLPRFHRMKKGA